MSILSYLEKTGSTLATKELYHDYCRNNRTRPHWMADGDIVEVQVRDFVAFSERRLFDIEEEIAGHLRRFWPLDGPSSAGPFRFPLAPETGLNAGQHAAIALLTASGGGCLTGGPGTGKTYLAAQMIKTCRQNGLQVKIAAPTGKAASVLSAKLGGLEVKTLHSLLGMSPTEKVSQFAGDDVGLDCDVLFVDEMSMVDSEMFLQLMRSLYNETHIIFIGDVNQIDPIGPGAPFADMLHNIPTATLTEIVRQKAGNGIISFASSILASKWEPPASDVEFLDSKRPHEDAFELFGTFDLLHEAQDVMILCPVRDPKFDSSITKLNQRISQARGLERIDENFAIGDVIQFTSNTKEYGFVNGERGVIEKYEKHGARANEVIIRNTNDRIYRLHNYSLAKHAELGYATTVHKAQGSECKTVILLLPREAQHMLTEQLLYTAVTRAKERLIVIGEKTLIKYKVTQRRIWRQNVLWGFLTGVITPAESIQQPLLEHYL